MEKYLEKQILFNNEVSLSDNVYSIINAIKIINSMNIKNKELLIEFSNYFNNIVYSNGKYLFTKENPTTIYNISTRKFSISSYFTIFFFYVFCKPNIVF